MPTEPAAVAAAITAALAGLPTLRPRWVSGTNAADRPEHVSATGRPRLTIVVSGERRVLAPVDGAVQLLRLTAGDVLIVAAEGWTRPHPRWLAPIVALNPFDDSTRFEAPGLAWDSGGPLNPAAWALLAAVVHLGAIPDHQHRADGLIRGCIAVALADCRPWPGRDRAHRDWAAARAAAHDHPDAGRDRLAAIAGVHPNHLSRLCRRFEGLSLIGWLTRLRMERARALLSAGMDAEATARACGYAEASHFRRTFRRMHGLPPQAWLAQRRR